jgi:protein gp37
LKKKLGYRDMTMDDLRRDLFAVIDGTPWLDWLLLTKRPQNVRKMWTWGWGTAATLDERDEWNQHPFEKGKMVQKKPALRSNVWLITSISDQHSADLLIPELLKCRDLVPVLGVSAEPLLDEVNLAAWLESDLDRYSRDDRFGVPKDASVAKLDWIILGGESGHHARPCDVAWIRSGVEQCLDAGVPVFVKQLGADPVMQVCASQLHCAPVLKDKKGGDMAEFPEDLRVRQFPQPSRSP